MRFSVHAGQTREPIEFEFATAIEAVSKAWQLVAARASGVYVYDDEADMAYWPNTFAELHKVSILPLSPREKRPS